MLYVLCGLPGCGKSTFCKTISAHILCADTIRGELFGDESIQSNPALVFSTLYHRCDEFLAKGEDVVIDATGLRRRDRAEALKHAKKYNAETTIIIFRTPVEVCMSRNANRARVVPAEVYPRMVKLFNEQYPTADEGFDHFVEIDNY